MSKPIYLNDSEIEEMLQALEKSLRTQKCFGSVNFRKTFTEDNRNATIIFSPIAWIKMKTLVEEFSSEVQWHGVVTRLSESAFEIRDIIVPPHKTSEATVTSEYQPYTDWLFSLDSDTFNSLRFHGHSHVNMGVTPSSVDDKYRQDLVTQMPIPKEGKDAFYIFMIFNKKGEWSGEIYDLKYNVLYNTKDIDICVLLEDGFLDSFISKAKEIAVKEIVPEKKALDSYSSNKKSKKEKGSGKSKDSDYKYGYESAGYDHYGEYEDYFDYYDPKWGR